MNAKQRSRACTSGVQIQVHKVTEFMRSLPKSLLRLKQKTKAISKSSAKCLIIGCYSKMAFASINFKCSQFYMSVCLHLRLSARGFHFFCFFKIPIITFGSFPLMVTFVLMKRNSFGLIFLFMLQLLVRTISFSVIKMWYFLVKNLKQSLAWLSLVHLLI